MLVLSRKLNEKIVIDGGIVLTVVKIDLQPGSVGNSKAAVERADLPRGNRRGPRQGTGGQGHDRATGRRRSVSITSCGQIDKCAGRVQKGPRQGFFLDNVGDVE